MARAGRITAIFRRFFLFDFDLCGLRMVSFEIELNDAVDRELEIDL